MYEAPVPLHHFSFGFYFKALTRMLAEPRRFFRELSWDAGWKQPVGFLIVSGLFSSLAGLTQGSYATPVLMGSIFFMNAVGMAVIAASLGYLVVIAVMGGCITFRRLFSIYAFSAGVTLLASWIPYFVWLTEPWKWWLIAVGLVHGCRFSWKQSLIVTAVSFSLVVFIFWLLNAGIT